jgi:predicted TPR repeat methyltransferase
MMTCPHCVGAELFFDEKDAQKDLRRYRAKGPMKTAQMLLDALGQVDVTGKRLLDIGGGVGVLQQELLKAGAASAVDVDGSTAYIAAALEEAERVGTRDQMEYFQGDFLDIAPNLEPADIVTLDRVLCCYPDVDGMVVRSTALANEFYGLVYPRKTFGARGAIKLANLFMKLKKNPFRAFVHDPKHIDSMVREAGFEPRYEGRTLVWHVVLYQRTRDERRAAPPESVERAA